MSGVLAQRPRSEDHEKVRFEPGPIHRTQAGDAGRKRNSLHVPGDLVADSDPQLPGKVLLQRYQSGCSGTGTLPGSLDYPLGGNQAVPIGRSILAPKCPRILRLFVLDPAV